jgi:hypothetical protein
MRHTTVSALGLVVLLKDARGRPETARTTAKHASLGANHTLHPGTSGQMAITTVGE